MVGIGIRWYVLYCILMLWLSFFCLSFCNARKSSSERGSSFTDTRSRVPLRLLKRPPELPPPAPLEEAPVSVGDLPRWLKKSNKVLAFTYKQKRILMIVISRWCVGMSCLLFCWHNHFYFLCTDSFLYC